MKNTIVQFHLEREGVLSWMPDLPPNEELVREVLNQKNLPLQPFISLGQEQAYAGFMQPYERPYFHLGDNINIVSMIDKFKEHHLVCVAVNILELIYQPVFLYKHLVPIEHLSAEQTRVTQLNAKPFWVTTSQPENPNAALEHSDTWFTQKEIDKYREQAGLRWAESIHKYQPSDYVEKVIRDTQTITEKSGGCSFSKDGKPMIVWKASPYLNTTHTPHELLEEVLRGASHTITTTTTRPRI